VTRFVIDQSAALELARLNAMIPAHHRLLAPTLLQSQVLAHLYAAVRGGALDRREGYRRLHYVRKLKMRRLGDHVLQDHAWRIADQLGWHDTYAAEYIALTRLQADAFVTLDADLAIAVRDIVPLASLDDLIRG
jgi:predicted nucleic acid-binding protein